MKIAIYIAADESSPSGLRWVKTQSNRVKPGDIAGWRNPDGYWYATFERKKIKAHRLVYFLTHGVWPASNVLVDHKNRNRSDNRAANLRLATKAENCRNTKRRVDNRSGHKGISRHSQYDRWQVNIQGKYIGVFASLEEAVSVRKAVETEIFGEFAGE